MHTAPEILATFAAVRREDISPVRAEELARFIAGWTSLETAYSAALFNDRAPYQVRLDIIAYRTALEEAADPGVLMANRLKSAERCEKTAAEARELAAEYRARIGKWAPEYDEENRRVSEGKIRYAECEERMAAKYRAQVGEVRASLQDRAA